MVIWVPRLFAVISLLLGAASPAEAGWLRAESPNFIAFSDGDEAGLRTQVTMLEDYAALLRVLSGTADGAPPAAKLRIYFVRRQEDMRHVPPLSGLFPGFYTATPSGIAAFVNVAAPASTEVLFHEYAHHFMMQYHADAYPPWYVEGFAEYLGPTRFTERHIELGRMNGVRSSWLFQRSDWLPTERVMFERGQITTLEGLARFYAQSWLITHYLFGDEARRSQLIRYLQAIGRGEAQPAAFQANFGITPVEMHRRLVRYSRDGITYRRLDRASVGQPVEIAVTALPPSADRLLLAEAALRIGRKIQPDELERIRREAGRSDDPFARRVLAFAETMHGDAAVGERLLTTLLESGPNDAELLYLRGMRHIVAARTAEGDARLAQLREARPWFARSHRADPMHFATLYRYSQAISATPDSRSENNLNILLLALQLAPQVGEIRLNAGTMLLLRGEFAQAEAVLQPLASTAHGESAINESARTLLQRARERSTEGVELAFEGPGKVE